MATIRAEISFEIASRASRDNDTKALWLLPPINSSRLPREPTQIFGLESIRVSTVLSL